MGPVLSLRGAAARVQFASKPAYLACNGSDNQVSLRELVETKCPSLFAPFRQAWWLFNGHLQTIYCVLGDFTNVDKVTYERKYLQLLDGGTIGLDFAPSNHESLPEDVPIIVVLHGLTGGSYESYVRSILQPACAPVENGGLGYRAVVANFRGCAGVPITSQQLYSAGHTDDIRQALLFISNLYPKAPLLGLGFSLGANILTRYIAEEGEQSRLSAACALACPWNLAKNNDMLLSTYIGTHVYAKGMGSNLLKLLKRNATPLARNPEHHVARALGRALLLKSPTLAEFDNTFTCVAGGSSPPFPFANADEYYHWASSHKALGDIRVPFLAINAADDPVVQDVPMHGAENGHVVMALTPNGGHLGWFESAGGLDVRRWIAKPVLEWLQAIAETIPTRSQSPSIYVDDDGYLREDGRPGIGCREVQEGILVEETKPENGLLQGL